VCELAKQNEYYWDEQRVEEASAYCALFVKPEGKKPF
jgi:hypothetical protein